MPPQLPTTHPPWPGNPLTFVVHQHDILKSALSPPCRCIDCQHSFYAIEEQFRPMFWYKANLTAHPMLVQEIISDHVQQSESDRQYLTKRLESHGDLIMSRWKKKARGKREEILVKAIPEICLYRFINPLFCYTGAHKKTGMGERTEKHRKQLLLHWFNVEVLKTSPAVLFALLHNRTVYPLQDWAPFDQRQLILSWACGHFDVKFSPMCVVMYGSEYGKVVDWDAESAHRADIVGFPKAELVLEAQSLLMTGLRKVVDIILDGVDFNVPGSSKNWKAMSRGGFRHNNEVELWSPYTNQAFSAPPYFSIDAIISLIDVRLSAQGDHLIDLQTDPAYMRRYIRVMAQGIFYKAIPKHAEGLLLTTQLSRAVYNFWRMTWIRSECEHVRGIRDRFRDSIRPGQPLPKAYDRALGALELLVVNGVNRLADGLAFNLFQRPGFSHKYTSSQDPQLGEDLLHMERNPAAPVDQKLLYDQDPLEWCLTQLQGRPDVQTNYDHAVMFSFLEAHLAKSNAKDNARIDELLFQELSDLASCHEILVSIRLHRPQNEACDLDELLESETEMSRIAWKTWKPDAQLSLDKKDISKLGADFSDSFHQATTPVGKKNTVWLKNQKLMRTALENFWDGLKKSCALALGQSGLMAGEISFCTEIISATTNPDYKALVEGEERAVMEAVKKDRGTTAGPAQKEWGSSGTEELTTAISKKKNKTRPAEAETNSKGNVEGIAALKIDTPSNNQSLPKIEVKKRAFTVLNCMYPESAADTTKTIDWDNFVHAMVDMGFSARNGGGSAVVFENQNGDGKSAGGRIIFHKPHPVPKVDPIMLQSWGRRMSKWFGWQKELFVPEP
ncbi:hypothetical protein GLAREA_05914 [Glarea lozoyensis ATCC 20868]|uniref:Uncharacterized protein n=1 Tax=Glarea lozoyensis (strain ATCC 20868 / MF5171) TaxID=1116229 RepID=S3D330_GLAL2|nr:uncharacterized protein GLAREA_05914 [Glarea lozoyensis ATCC 20868]EPE32902.1 hypothetical protein GLAREA_05914 [Glarea lozoyensis ATCC 20868]